MARAYRTSPQCTSVGVAMAHPATRAAVTNAPRTQRGGAARAGTSPGPSGADRMGDDRPPEQGRDRQRAGRGPSREDDTALVGGDHVVGPAGLRASHQLPIRTAGVLVRARLITIR